MTVFDPPPAGSTTDPDRIRNGPITPGNPIHPAPSWRRDASASAPLTFAALDAESAEVLGNIKQLLNTGKIDA